MGQQRVIGKSITLNLASGGGFGGRQGSRRAELLAACHESLATSHLHPMHIAVGCDHAGYPLKAHVVEQVRAAGHHVIDCGATQLLPGDDYPDYALAVAQAVRAGRAERGIVVCGSGVGVSVAANKVPGIRACMCHDTFSARQGVEDDSMNVLCLGARVIGPELASDVIKAFLSVKFSGAERHQRRLDKVKKIEADALDGKFE